MNRTCVCTLGGLTFVLGSAVPTPVLAQDASWQHTLGIYLMGAALDGETAVGPVAGSVDVSFDEILSNLELGGMAFYRAQRGEWALNVDAIFVALGGHDTLAGNIGFDVDLDQLILAADLSYIFSERFETLVGVRYYGIDAQLARTSPNSAPVTRGDDEDWIDPYVGARATFPISESTAFVLRGDVGGFDVGSDFAWNLVARFEWQASERLFATLGYRVLDVDYDNDESGLEFFRYDIQTSGPVAGIGWRF